MKSLLYKTKERIKKIKRNIIDDRNSSKLERKVSILTSASITLASIATGLTMAASGIYLAANRTQSFINCYPAYTLHTIERSKEPDRYDYFSTKNFKDSSGKNLPKNVISIDNEKGKMTIAFPFDPQRDIPKRFWLANKRKSSKFDKFNIGDIIITELQTPDFIQSMRIYFDGKLSLQYVRGLNQDSFFNNSNVGNPLRRYFFPYTPAKDFFLDLPDGKRLDILDVIERTNNPKGMKKYFPVFDLITICNLEGNTSVGRDLIESVSFYLDTSSCLEGNHQIKVDYVNSRGRERSLKREVVLKLRDRESKTVEKYYDFLKSQARMKHEKSWYPYRPKRHSYQERFE